MYLLFSEWENATFSKLWPGWDLTIRLSGAKEKYNIEDIGKYYAVVVKMICEFSV